MNNDNNAVQDELQQAINNITNSDNGGNADDTAADPIAEIENNILENQNKNDDMSILGEAPAPELPNIPAPEAPSFETNSIESNTADISSGMDIVQPLNVQPGRAMYGDPDMDRVKVAALTDIRPILEKIEGIDVERKFMVYKDIIELTDDKSCLELAYNAASKMEDDKKRAEALLFVIEAVDRLGIQIDANN